MGIVVVGVCVDQVSQPPLLSMMVRTVHSESADLTLVEQALPVLFKEHNFWTTGT